MKNRRLLINCITAVLVCVLCVSGWNLFKIYREYREGDQLYESVRTEYMLKPILSPEEEEKLTASTGEYKAIPLDQRIDLEKLMAVNGDVLGWIYIPDTTVDYPLLQSVGNNDVYLYATFEKQYSSFGSIFVDFRNNGLSDYNTVIHGHNMQNGAMFGELMRYGKADYAEAHPVIYILTEEGVLAYEVYSAYRTVVDSPSYTFGFASEDAYWRFVEMTLRNSVISTEVTIDTVKPIITLSTCADSEESVNRFVVHAVLMEEAVQEEPPPEEDGL